MKRSEMLLILQQSMVEAPEDIDQAADYLLKRLEKAGMRAPLVPIGTRIVDEELGEACSGHEFLDCWEIEEES